MSRDPQPPAPSGSKAGPYLLAPIACRHREQSRQMILRAAEAVTPGRAVVLGAGPCEEIPLVELATRFAEVTLNDVDEKPLVQALGSPELSPHREKLTIEIADLTGITDMALEEIERVLAPSADAPSGIAAMTDALEHVQPGPFPIAGPFDLVVASCVLSQLHFALTHESERRFSARFHGQAEALRQSQFWKTALERAARRMEDKFMADLASLVTPNGRAYLSESAQMCYIQRAPGGQWQTEGTYRMLRTTDLADYLQGRFTIVERRRWEWVVAPPQSDADTGRLYDVQAMILRSAVAGLTEAGQSGGESGG